MVNSRERLGVNFSRLTETSSNITTSARELEGRNKSIKANALPHSPGWGDNHPQNKFAPNKTRRGNRRMGK